MNKKNTVITIICIIISSISGFITKDVAIGGFSLLTGLLCAYYASIGNRVNYLFGLINYLIIGYVAFKNNLYGIFFFYIFIFAPLQVQGFITWNKNLYSDSKVKIRQFTFKNSIIITVACLLGSLILGYFLTLIPNQKLAFMDAASNCINLCGIILLILRFKESWLLWLINNVIDLIIWLITALNHGENSTMMLLVSIGYLLINIYGLIKWNIEAKNKN